MTYIETLVLALLSFIFKLIGTVIEFSLMVLLIYGVIYTFLRFVICWKTQTVGKFCGTIFVLGVKDGFEAFKDIMPAVKMSAKQWAKDKMEELR